MPEIIQDRINSFSVLINLHYPTKDTSDDEDRKYNDGNKNNSRYESLQHDIISPYILLRRLRGDGASSDSGIGNLDSSAVDFSCASSLP